MLKKNSLNKTLFILIGILIITYVLSFFYSGKKTAEKKEELTTSLLNPKNIDKIDSIEINKNDEFIFLQKKDDFWVLLNNDNSPVPANSDFVYSFFNDLSQIRKLYKITDKLEKNNKFGLQDENKISIKYTLSDGTFQQLYFGNYDFSLSFRYFMTGKNLNIYQIDNSFEKYLNINIQNWADPYIVSKSIMKRLSSENVQRVIFNQNGESKKISDNSKLFSTLLELRHGGIGQRNEINEKNRLLTVKIEAGDKTEVLLEFFPSISNENNFIIRTTYSLDLKRNYLFYTKISIMTYNNIKEMML